MEYSEVGGRLQALRNTIETDIIGQKALIDRLFISLLCDGHLLVEGVPGLAKTRAIQSLSKGIAAQFQRIQFTPDLLPGDITGTEIYRQQSGDFVFQQGPIFSNLVLADEINRAPAKVQSALLEAMAERQVSVGSKTYPMQPLFLVMATQNPIEQEGTYSLPEAQLDRFMLHVRVDYPTAEEEASILQLVEQEQLNNAKRAEVSPAQNQVSINDILAAREQVFAMELPDSVRNYIVQLTVATRHPERYDAKLGSWIMHGVSPRATIAMAQAARAFAWLSGDEIVTPAAVQEVAEDVLRHRVILSIEAEANGVSASQVVQTLLDHVPAI